MARRSFPLAWVATYRATSNKYASTDGKELYAGGQYDDQTFLGIPSTVKEAIATSKGTIKLLLRMNVKDSGIFEVNAHRETYNKKSGATPWYTPLGVEPSLTTGWKEIDITSVFMSQYLEGNYHGIALTGRPTNYAVAVGKTGGSDQATFIVEGTWNEDPNPPTKFINPVASTVASGVLDVRWTAGADTDTPADKLRYELEYWNGSKWYERWRVPAGSTSYSYPVNDKPETSSARFRIRSIDEDNRYSAWTYSQHFAVEQNEIPQKPTNLSPASGQAVARGQVIRLSWRHMDDGAQAGYSIRWRTVATDGTKGNWIYIPDGSMANSTRQYHDAQPDTFGFNTEIEWQVQTVDQGGEVSPWSSQARFYAGELSNAPIWLEPTNGSVVNSNRVIAQWSTLDQRSYQIELRRGETVVWSETAISNAKRTSVEYDLENGANYNLRLRIMDNSSGLYSDWSYVYFVANFTPPSKPTMSISDADGTVNISWDTNIDLIDNEDGAFHYTPRTAKVNYQGKLRGNMTLNPHRMAPLRATGYPTTPVGLITSSTESAQAEYDQVSSQGADLFRVTGTDGTNQKAMQVFEFDLKALIRQQLGLDVSTQWLKDNLLGMTVNWVGYGDDGNGSFKGNLGLWSAQTNTWDVTRWLTTESTSARELTGNITQPALRVTDDGKMYFIAHSEAQKTAGLPAHIYTDFIEVTVSFKELFSTTTQIDVLRREYNASEEQEWQVLATDLSINSSFVDYSPASEQPYEYKVRAWADNLTFTDSDVQELTIMLEYAFLHRASVLSDLIILYAEARDQSPDFSGQMMVFANRRLPVYEHGVNEQNSVTIDFSLDTVEEHRNFMRFIRRKETFLYRDNNGRRMYCVITAPKIKDKDVNGFDVTMTLAEVDYVEPVQGG